MKPCCEVRPSKRKEIVVHVSVDGDDSNSGLSSHCPKRTLKSAIRCFRKFLCVRIVLSPGNYRLTGSSLKGPRFLTIEGRLQFPDRATVTAASLPNKSETTFDRVLPNGFVRRNRVVRPVFMDDNLSFSGIPYTPSFEGENVVVEIGDVDTTVELPLFLNVQNNLVIREINFSNSSSFLQVQNGSLTVERSRLRVGDFRLENAIFKPIASYLELTYQPGEAREESVGSVSNVRDSYLRVTIPDLTTPRLRFFDSGFNIFNSVIQGFFNGVLAGLITMSQTRFFAENSGIPSLLSQNGSVHVRNGELRSLVIPALKSIGNINLTNSRLLLEGSVDSFSHSTFIRATSSVITSSASMLIATDGEFGVDLAGTTIRYESPGQSPGQAPGQAPVNLSENVPGWTFFTGNQQMEAWFKLVNSHMSGDIRFFDPDVLVVPKFNFYLRDKADVSLPVEAVDNFKASTMGRISFATGSRDYPQKGKYVEDRVGDNGSLSSFYLS